MCTRDAGGAAPPRVRWCQCAAVWPEPIKCRCRREGVQRHTWVPCPRPVLNHAASLRPSVLRMQALVGLPCGACGRRRLPHAVQLLHNRGGAPVCGGVPRPGHLVSASLRSRLLSHPCRLVGCRGSAVWQLLARHTCLACLPWSSVGLPPRPMLCLPLVCPAGTCTSQPLSWPAAAAAAAPPTGSGAWCPWAARERLARRSCGTQHWQSRWAERCGQRTLWSALRACLGGE